MTVRPSLSLRAELANRPGRLSHALRITLACVLTCLLVQYYQTPQAALSVYIVFFLVKPDQRSSIVQSIAVVLLMGVIIGLLLLIIQQVIDEPILRLASMAGLSLFFMFVAQASKLKPVGAILALILAYTLDLVGQAFIGELATRALLYGWLAAIIPAGVCLTVAWFFAPSAAQLLRKTLASYFRLAAAQFQLSNTPQNTQQDSHPPEAEAWQYVLHEDQKALQQWLKLSAKQHDVHDLPQLRRCCTCLGPLLLVLEQCRKNLPQLPAQFSAQHLAHYLHEFAEALETQQALPEFPASSPTSNATIPHHTSLRELSALFSFITTNNPVTPSHISDTDESKASSGFWLADAFTNPDYPRLALKTSAAALICYLIYSLLDWSGIHTSLITCYIVALASTAETVQKLRLRLIGCLIGCAAGVATILLIMPQINSLAALLILVALSSLAAAWVVAGSARIAYAGLQIAFAYYLCVLQGHGPAFDLVIPRDRVIGIVLGLIVVYLIFVQLWPVSLARQIEQSLSQAQKLLAQLCQPDHEPDQTASSQWYRYDLLNQVCCELNFCQQGYALLEYEPSAVRPAAVWLARRQRLLASLQRLTPQLLIPPDWSATTRRQVHQLLLQSAALCSTQPEQPCEDKPNALSLQLEQLLPQFLPHHAPSDGLSHEILTTSA